MQTDAKNARRRELKEARVALGQEGRARMDEALARAVVALPEFEQARAVFSYLSFGAEVDTRAIIEQAWKCGKTVALPRCVPNSRLMTWHEVTSFDDLELSSFGVEEPADDDATRIDPAAEPLSLALVPGLEFDERGYRLGYGGGFYDTFLSAFAGNSVGLCREQFLSAAPLAVEPHDLPTDIVVTDVRVIRCNQA